MTIPVSVLILTYNEEKNIKRCLESVYWCNDVVVLDSYSNDSTEDIVREVGVRFLQRNFDDYAGQRNYGIYEIKYKYDWLFMLDADEVFSVELLEEIEHKLNDCDESICLFRLRRKDYFFGRWIKYSSTYSGLWLGRLMRIGSVWVQRSINEEYQTRGKVELLHSSLLHFPMNKGFHAWLEKHNRYSTMEAELQFNKFFHDWKIGDLINIDPAIRRKSLKAIVYSLPLRPVIVFMGLYFIKGGFLDGRQGLTYCILKTIYEYMIDCKVRELRQRSKNLPV